MELKKGEKIVKKGEVSSDWPGTSAFGNLWGTLGMAYLTNKRLFLEYYEVIPVEQTKNEFEIPLEELTGVNKWPYPPLPLSSTFKVEYSHNGKPGAAVFTTSDSLLWWSNASIADDWIAQIRNTANLKITHPSPNFQNVRVGWVIIVILIILILVAIVLYGGNK
jgi:hypothetical protein